MEKVVKKRIQNDIENVGERVYQTEDYLDILKDVMEDIITQTHLMRDEELSYDRHNFMRSVRKIDVLDTEDKNGYKDYPADIHSISMTIVQLAKKGEILYTEKIEEDE